MQTATYVIGWWTLGVSVLTGGLSMYQPPLPHPTKIAEAVKTSEPTQTTLAETTPRTLKYGNFTYTLEPKYAYDIYGLVVAEHTSKSWLDLAHENDPGNTRDLCVVWGENITNGAYRKVSYSHGDFTCYYRWKTPPQPAFVASELANNHLLPANAAVEQRISQVAVGDQIHIRGTLVNYQVRDAAGLVVGTRTTSTTRDDSGNGACEVILTEDLEIIGRGNVGLVRLKRSLPWISGGSALLWLMAFVAL